MTFVQSLHPSEKIKKSNQKNKLKASGSAISEQWYFMILFWIFFLNYFSAVKY